SLHRAGCGCAAAEQQRTGEPAQKAQTAARSSSRPSWLTKSAGMVSGIATPSARATRSETSRRTTDIGMLSAVQMEESSSEEASFCPRSTSERYPSETRAAEETSRSV